MKNKLLLCFFIIIHHNLYSQIEVGTWRDHLPYINATNVLFTGSKIVCSTPYSLFSLQAADNSLEKHTRSNGLSDVGISTANYDPQSGILLVTYTNANVDIIKGNTIYNLSDLKNKPIQGDKTIYQIEFQNQLAYLATGFGIVVIDINKKEVKETYYIGPGASAIEVFSICFSQGYIYAATSGGIYRAEAGNPNLIDYNQWQKLNNLPNPSAKYSYIQNFNNQIFACVWNNTINTTTVLRQNEPAWTEMYEPGFLISKLRTFNNKLFVVEEKSITIFDQLLTQSGKISTYGFASAEPNDVYETNDGKIYIGDRFYGLVFKHSNSEFSSAIPNGPYNNHAWDIDAAKSQVWVAGGGHTSFGANLYNFGELYQFKNEEWSSHIQWNSNARDFSKIYINPLNPSQVFVGSWGAGVYVFENASVSMNYNDQNSSLQSIIPGQDFIRIGGILLDRDKDLYVTNVGVSSPISVKTEEGSWYSYNYPELTGAGDVAEIIETQDGNKWVQLARGGGLFVFNDQKTPEDQNDDQKRKFSIYDETGQFITNVVYSIAEDNNGVVWVGTDMGVFTYYNPGEVFDQAGFFASRVKVPDQSNPDFVQYLLAKEKITAIAIDGANRKWFGTESSGVFLMSADCESEIFHFTKENSKLLSDNIYSIAIDPKSGEVFFGTETGIVSFKGTATKGDDTYENAYIYPNPVREDYDGLITITGIADGADVKITDIAGQLVYTVKAFGGQAIWNGLNYSGKKVKTGVYMVFCTDQSGMNRKVLKLLVIN